MATRNRRSSASSQSSTLGSSSSSLANKNSVSENPCKAMAVKAQLAKKRPPLTNLTNRRNGPQKNDPRTTLISSTMVQCDAKFAKMKKGFSTFIYDENSSENPLLKSSNGSSNAVSCKDTYVHRVDQPLISFTAIPALSCMDVSTSQSDNCSVSLDESMSTCDSLGSPEFEYMDKDGDLAVSTIERKTCDILVISGDMSKRNTFEEIETVCEVGGVDNTVVDPQFCATIACDIYQNLRVSETKKRPSANFMEKIQKDINASMRAILIDWLVEVAEEYRLVPETLFLAVNYLDRYLSGNTINKHKLQLLGVACMMIAAKYEEICAPQAEEFCYITDNTYSKNEVLQMESAVLDYLKFDMIAPTARCFLKRFVRAAQRMNEVP